MRLDGKGMRLELALRDSAQCFTWHETEAGWLGSIGGAPVLLRECGTEIEARGALTQAELAHFLDLDRDYAALAAEFAAIPQARRAIEMYPGLRVLNQDPWETLVSFILSANNNVVRIRRLVAALQETFGETQELDGQLLHELPKPERLAGASEETLRDLGTGYRAPYLIRTAQAVAEGFPIYALQNMEYEEAHRRLTELTGVGDKVADCVLLFGCGHACAFPVDVWVEKLLKSWFGFEGESRTAMARRARALLGPHAGILQQFLFHAARMGDIQV